MRRRFSTICLALAATTAASADLNEVWSRTFGGTCNDGARAMVPAGDGGYILAGYTYSFGDAEGNAYLVKTDDAGQEEWSQVFGGPGRDYAVGVCPTSDGGYVFTGTTTSFGRGRKDLYLVKVDGEGSEVWSRTYGGPAADEGWAVCETSDGGLLIAGRTESFGAGGSDIWILKTDAAGDTAWTRTAGGPEWDWSMCVLETAAGDYVAVGTTGSASGNRDLYAVKLTPAGETVWTQAYGSLVQLDADWGWSAICDGQGGFVLVGHGNDHAVNDAGNVWLYHIDALGMIDWGHAYSESVYYEHGHAVCATADGGYLVCGIKKDAARQRNDYYFLKTDGQGVRQWAYWPATPAREWPVAVCEPYPGRYTVGGFTDGEGAGRFDMHLVHLIDPTAQSVEMPRASGLSLRASSVLNGRAAIHVHTSDSGPVRLHILSADGRVVADLFEGRLARGEHPFIWEAAGSPSGVYYCLAAGGGETVVHRMTLLR